MLMLRAELSADNAFSEASSTAPIAISADYAAEGKTDDGQRALVLRGHCRVQQGETVATAQRMVLWLTSASGKESIAAYLEDEVRVEQVGQSDQQPNAFLQMGTLAGGIDSRFRYRSTNEAVEQDAFFQRALARQRSVQRTALTQTQFAVPSQEQMAPSLRQSPPRDRSRRIRISPRSGMDFNIQSQKSTNTVPPEQITILTGGVNLIIEGVASFDVIDLSADRIVIWTEANEADQFSPDLVQSQDAQYQVYLEGNIVARQGNNVMRAERAYYDAREDRGLLLDAELSVKPPELGGQKEIGRASCRERVCYPV